MSTIDGLLLTIFEDIGPLPLVNLSSLTEDIAAHLSITGLTIVGFGSTARVYHRLFGSIPVPNLSDWEAMPFMFTVSGEDSSDDRIKTQGRECSFFLLFSSDKRSVVYTLHSEIEQYLINAVQQFKARSDLTPEATQEIFDQVNQIEATTTPDTPTPDQPPVIVEKAGLEFFTVTQDGDLQAVSLTDGLKAPILLVINHVNRMILKLLLADPVPVRIGYHAGRAANRKNVEEFRSAFRIRDIEDPIEIDMLLQQMQSQLK